MSQQKLHPSEINFFFHELIWSLLGCLDPQPPSALEEAQQQLAASNDTVVPH